MLNYTTTTIVNDPLSIHGNGKYDATTNPTGYDASDPLSKGWFRVNFGPELKKDSTHTPILVSKKSSVAAQFAEAEIALPTTPGIYRIAMYIRLRNNNNPYFYNNWTFKGRPLYIEFTIATTGGDDADSIIARTKKLALAQYGYDLVKLSKNGTNLVITAADQWEIFMDQDAQTGVKLEELQNIGTNQESFVNVTIPVTTTPSNACEVLVDNGHEAFGDFAHLVKDLRLPTDANRRWQGIAEGDVFGGEPNDDKPIPNGMYAQYTIQYTSDRGVLQQSALGGVATSRTVHIFYVLDTQTVINAFEAMLESVGINETPNGDITAATLAASTAGYSAPGTQTI